LFNTIQLRLNQYILSLGRQFPERRKCMNDRPIILGIVGGSAAGKTTLTRGIAQVLGEENVTVICLLRAGQAILKPIYNHSTGAFDPPEYIEPRQYLSVEGLLGYSTRRMRDSYDVKNLSCTA